MCLPIRHNEVAKVPMKSIQEVYSNDDKEIWWDIKIKTSPTLEHNKPDIVLAEEGEEMLYNRHESWVRRQYQQ